MSVINCEIISIGEKQREKVQFDIPHKINRFKFLTLIFEKEQFENHKVCHNIYKRIA